MKDLLKYLFLQYFQYRWQTVTLLMLMLFTLAYQVTFAYSFKYLIDQVRFVDHRRA